MSFQKHFILEVGPGLTFRLIPSMIEVIASSLWIVNMDFSELANVADEDRILRGFATD